MPNVKFELNLDNRVKPGQQTIDEIITTLQAAGENPNAAEPIFDPITGKLIAVGISLPDTASAAAKAAIDANAGVATSTPALPDPLFLTDLTAIALATLTLAGSEQITAFAVEDAFSNFTVLGVLGASNVYTDLSANSSGRPFGVVQISDVGGAGYTVPVNDITLTDTVVGAKILANAAAIVIPAPAAAQRNADTYYIDNALKMYLAQRVVDSVPLFPFRTYAQAVAAGAV